MSSAGRHDSMLPGPAEVVRCTEHARSHGYDAGGTAIEAAVVVVADVPPPWPKPVFNHGALAGLEATMPTPFGRARLLAAIPTTIDSLVVRRFDRTPDGATLTTYQAAHERALGPLIRSVFALDHRPAAAEPVHDAIVLVCTQGTHDVCCGIAGTCLAMDLATDPSLTVLRVSHTGGHRFAPTAMTLPDGRMWANLDGATLELIRSHGAATSEIAPLCRGWWGAEPGAAQVAERAVFAEAGWGWNTARRAIACVSGDVNAALWDITGDGATWRVATAASRTVPVIDCRSPGGMPAKTTTEYTATIISRP